MSMQGLKGLDKELYERHMAKYDPEREAQAVEYVEAVSGLKLDDRSDVQGSLKSGNVLVCQMPRISYFYREQCSTISSRLELLPVKPTLNL